MIDYFSLNFLGADSGYLCAVNFKRRAPREDQRGSRGCRIGRGSRQAILQF